MLEAALTTQESLIAYRRRYRSFLELTATLEILLFDPSNPRAVLYQLDRLEEQVRQLPHAESREHGNAVTRLVLEAVAQLRLTDAQSLVNEGAARQWNQELDQRLARIAHLLTRLSETLTEIYFSHTQGPYALTQPAPDFEL
jgi:uncharacterized alpha-E superfamily protein